MEVAGHQVSELRVDLKRHFHPLLQELQCEICKQAPAQDPYALPCLHRFCGTCIEEHLQKHPKSPECPICRAPHLLREIRRDCGLGRIAEAVQAVYSAVQKSTRHGFAATESADCARTVPVSRIQSDSAPGASVNRASDKTALNGPAKGIGFTSASDLTSVALEELGLQKETGSLRGKRAMVECIHAKDDELNVSMGATIQPVRTSGKARSIGAKSNTNPLSVTNTFAEVSARTAAGPSDSDAMLRIQNAGRGNDMQICAEEPPLTAGKEPDDIKAAPVSTPSTQQVSSLKGTQNFESEAQSPRPSCPQEDMPMDGQADALVLKTSYPQDEMPIIGLLEKDNVLAAHSKEPKCSKEQVKTSSTEKVGAPIDRKTQWQADQSLEAESWFVQEQSLAAPTMLTTDKKQVLDFHAQLLASPAMPQVKQSIVEPAALQPAVSAERGSAAAPSLAPCPKEDAQHPVSDIRRYMAPVPIGTVFNTSAALIELLTSSPEDTPHRMIVQGDVEAAVRNGTATKVAAPVRPPASACIDDGNARASDGTTTKPVEAELDRNSRRGDDMAVRAASSPPPQGGTAVPADPSTTRYTSPKNLRATSDKEVGGVVVMEQPLQTFRKPFRFARRVEKKSMAPSVLRIDERVAISAPRAAHVDCPGKQVSLVNSRQDQGIGKKRQRKITTDSVCQGQPAKKVRGAGKRRCKSGQVGPPGDFISDFTPKHSHKSEPPMSQWWKDTHAGPSDDRAVNGAKKRSGITPTVLFTGFTAEQLKGLESAVQSLGGRVATELDSSTRLIARETDIRGAVITPPGLAARRTQKYFQALLSGTWVLSVGWIMRSQEFGYWLPEEPFELQGDAVALGGPAAGRRRRASGELPGLFTGLRFTLKLCSAAPGMPSIQDIRLLLQLSGGSIVDEKCDIRGTPPAPVNGAAPPHLSSESAQADYGHTTVTWWQKILAISAGGASRKDRLVSKEMGWMVVPAAWLLDCISLGKIVPPHNQPCNGS